MRERREDIPILARYFLRLYAKEAGSAVNEISEEAESILKNYDWLGNVRELQNAMQHVVAFADNAAALPQHLPELGASARNQREYQAFHKVLQDTKCHLLEDAAVRIGGDYRKAALRLGLNPKSMHRYLKAYNLSHLLRR